MIVQRINLYQERFHEKRVWVSARQLAAALLLVIGAITLWSFLLQAELAQVGQQNRDLRASRDSLTAELQVANSELTAQLEDTRLDRDIETTARKISARKRVLNFVDGNQFGSGQGFSDYLVALSNLQIDSIWLSQVRLTEDFVQIRGSALPTFRALAMKRYSRVVTSIYSTCSGTRKTTGRWISRSPPAR